MQLLQRFFGQRQPAADSQSVTQKQTPDTQAIVVISGLPRSGTSMMMKMLEAGGQPILADFERAADTDNPGGYYELERVKQLDKGDTDWVGQARGKAVKIISALLEYLPPEHTYQVVFIHRRYEEVLASQRKMLANRGEATDAVSDEEMADLFGKHVAKVLEWVRQQPNFTLLELDYNDLLADPEPYVRTLNQFLGCHLDEHEMVSIVDPDLYRNRA